MAPWRSAAALCALLALAASAGATYCFNDDLLVFYPVDGRDSNSILYDRANVSTSPYNLVVSGARVNGTSGSIHFSSCGAYARSTTGVSRITSAVAATNEFTIELWVSTTGEALTEYLPSRIFAVSRGTRCPSHNGVMIGQQCGTNTRTLVATRVSSSGRTDCVTNTPVSLVDNSRALTHLVVIVRGERQLTYVNATLVGNHSVPGLLNTWSSSSTLQLGNEASLDRSWRGTLFKVAMWRRALNQSQVTALFAMGHNGNDDLSSNNVCSRAPTTPPPLPKDDDDDDDLATAGEYCFSDCLVAFYPITKDECRKKNSFLLDFSGFSGLHLELSDVSDFTWQPGGGSIRFSGRGAIASSKRPASRITEAIRRTSAFTVELWLSTNSQAVKGDLPARILALSRGAKCPDQNSFMVGQGSDRALETRLSTTKVHKCSEGSVRSSGSLPDTITSKVHVVVTFAGGVQRIYINGVLDRSADIRGDLSKWSLKNLLVLGNECDARSAWSGILHKVAMWNCELSAANVNSLFLLGSDVNYPNSNCTRRTPPPPPPPQGNGSICASVEDARNGYSLIYRGRVFNGVNTTFTYTFSIASSAADIGHWVLGVCPEMQSYFRLASPACAWGFDNVTRLYGCRFSQQQTRGTSVNYTIVFTGNVGEDDTDFQYGIKGNNSCAISVVRGPCCGCAGTGTPPGQARYCVDPDVIAYYPFNDGSGTLVRDQAPFSASNPLNLRIRGDATATWLSQGRGLLLTGADGVLESVSAATNLTRTLRTANRFSVEVWLTKNSGSLPMAGVWGTIISLADSSACPSGINFAVSHSAAVNASSSEGSAVFRTRTSTAPDCAAIERSRPAFHGGEDRVHLVVTWSTSRRRMFVDGALVLDEAVNSAHGNLAVWNDTYFLRMGNERQLDRDWRGALHKVSIWRRDLNHSEVMALYSLGAFGGDVCNEPPVAPPNNCQVPCKATVFDPVDLPEDGMEFSCPEDPRVCQVVTDEFCPPSIPDHFDVEDLTRADRALFTNATLYPSNHAFYLENWVSSALGTCYQSLSSTNQALREWIFDPWGRFQVIHQNGTARLTGTIRQTVLNRFGDYFKMDVDIVFSGRVAAPQPPPSGSPKKELTNTAWATIDLSQWVYYTSFTGTLTGLGPLAGAVYRVDRRGPAFQMGIGANGKNLNYGGSSWFTLVALSNSTGSCRMNRTILGDINIDIKPGCVIEAPPPGDEDIVCEECRSNSDCVSQFPRDLAQNVTCLPNGQCRAVVNAQCAAIDDDVSEYQLVPRSLATAAIPGGQHAWWCHRCWTCPPSVTVPSTNWVFVAPGTFDEDTVAGTARLRGTLVNTANSQYLVQIDANFTGRVDPPNVPSGSPKLENGFRDTRHWYYYTETSGIVWSTTGPLAGFSAWFVREGPSFQVGIAANGKNDLFGASGWLKFDNLLAVTQPTANNTCRFQFATCINATAAVPTAPVVGNNCQAVSPSTTGYNVSFTSRVFSNGRTNFTYTVSVSSSAQFALSNWALSICDGLQSAFFSASPGATWVRPDPNTGIAGIKWDQGLEKGRTAVYWIVFNGNIPVASNVNYYATKGSTRCASAKIDGPSCANCTGVSASDININLNVTCELTRPCEPPVVEPCIQCTQSLDCVSQFPTGISSNVRCRSDQICEAKIPLPCEQVPLGMDKYNFLGENVSLQDAIPGSNHAFWCSRCFVCPSGVTLSSDWRFVNGSGEFVEYPNGTALAQGTVYNTANALYTLRFRVILSGRVNPPNVPAGSPKIELSPAPDTTRWYYYTSTDGFIFANSGPLSGLNVQIARFGPAFQIGVGANGKNLLFGGSGWLTAVNQHLWSQPASGCRYQFTSCAGSGTSYPPQTNPTPGSCTYWSTSSAKIVAQFVSRVYNPATDRTNFTYRVNVSSSAPHALSHWVLGMCPQLGAAITSTSVGSGGSFSNPDPTSGLIGYKFDVPQQKGTSQLYWIEFRGFVDVAVNGSSWVAKASTNCNLELISGPSCVSCSGPTAMDFNWNIPYECTVEPICEPPVEPPTPCEDCVSRCNTSFDCRHAFPKMLPNRTIKCVENRCQLVYNNECPSMEFDCYDYKERVCAKAPCGHSWFCGDCFTCPGISLSPSWAFVGCDDQCASWVEDTVRGTALLTGVLENLAIHANYKVNIEVLYSGLVRAGETPPAGSPNFGSRGPKDTSMWYYYTQVDGRIFATSGPLAGLEILFSRLGPAHQVGISANLIEDTYGVGGRVNITRVTQPTGANTCRFINISEARYVSELVLELFPRCTVTATCNSTAGECPPAMEAFTDVSELQSRRETSVYTARTRVGSTNTGVDELLLLSGSNSVVSSANLNYPVPSTSTPVTQARSFAMRYLPPSLFMYTETVLSGPGGASASVSSTVTVHDYFNALFLQVDNDCLGPQNRLTVSRLTLNVAGADVPINGLFTKVLGTTFSKELLEIVNTEIDPTRNFTLEGQIRISRQVFQIGNVTQSCSIDQMGFAVNVAEATRRDCPLPLAECPRVLNFDTGASNQPIVRGERLNQTQPYAAWGVTISTLVPSQPANSLAAMAFNTSAPTGGDFDLGTPHQNFSGPGVGLGGRRGTPGQNSVPLGNVLIISEDNNSNNPDDNANGGTLRFSFQRPMDVAMVGMLDLDSGTSRIVALDGSGATLLDRALQNAGDNGYQDEYLGVANVRTLDVRLAGSGAVAFVELCPSTGVPEPPIITCPVPFFNRTSLMLGGTYRLRNHPDGVARPPLYGLRLDGLTTQQSSEIFTFDFEHPQSDMRMNWDPTTRELEIYGVAYGGRDNGTTYAPGFPHRFTVQFVYKNVQRFDTYLNVPPSTGDVGKVVNTVTGAEYRLVASAMSGSFFRVSAGHRGVSTFSGWGWVDHSGLPHIADSDWLFTIADCLGA